jgi:hypothetical protein
MSELQEVEEAALFDEAVRLPRKGFVRLLGRLREPLLHFGALPPLSPP